MSRIVLLGSFIIVTNLMLEAFAVECAAEFISTEKRAMRERSRALRILVGDTELPPNSELFRVLRQLVREKGVGEGRSGARILEYLTVEDFKVVAGVLELNSAPIVGRLYAYLYFHGKIEEETEWRHQRPIDVKVLEADSPNLVLQVTYPGRIVPIDVIYRF